MTLQELRERQAWSLEQKIDHSLGTIEAFVRKMGGLDKVYISFSGGKDSTVLSHIARILYPDILHVFINTGNEYPDIIRFVAQQKANGVNILTLHPDMTPRRVWATYGFPLVSKEASDGVLRNRRCPDCPTSLKVLSDERSSFTLAKRWRYLISEPYSTSNQCCDILKKRPAHKFQKETGRAVILGIMASESMLRGKTYIRTGRCNVFSEKPHRSYSHPLAIWMEQDIWDYIDRFNVPIAEIYQKGAKRTGCVGCGFGCYFKDDVRFQLLHDLYPKYYEMVMNYTNNGVTYREALRKLLAVVDKHLPDEAPKTLFDL